ncbi:MAG: hypothetical protein JSV84_17165 [Gemmatimonadota bacterium]|nr:MAG: hypothetical protein JSV84_17165 [Gemmatimonadota bacterium]
MRRIAPRIISPLIIATLSVFAIILLRSPDRVMIDRGKYEEFLKEQYQKLPNYSSEDLKEIPKPEHPDLAAFQDYFMTLDPDLGRVPTERLKDAFRETQAIRKEAGQRPTAFDLTWEGTSANMGGRTRALMIDPNEPSYKTAWAGGVTGGLWYNNDITDDNSEWIPVDDFWDNLAISCIAYDPNNPEIFYVGTGEAFTAVTIYRESSGRGMGIWKSTDGGNTWHALYSTENFAYVTDIAVRDENNTSVIYAGVVSGVYHGIHESYPSDGLYRSEDGGEHWEQVLPNITGLSDPYAPADIEIGPDGRIYVGTLKNLAGEGGATILYSDDGTPGTWTVFDDYVTVIESAPTYTIPGRVMLSSAPSDENIVYAVIGSGFINTFGFNYSYGNHILRSTDGGTTWSETSIPPDNQYGNWATLAWHALTIGVDPNDPNTVFIGGLDLCKSTNAGESWTRVSDWTGMYYGGGTRYVHADQHAIVFKPGSSDEILFANDGGVFYTASGTSPQPIFVEKNRGYNTLQFYTCDIHPESNTNTYLGGLQDNGTLLYGDAPLDINDMVSGGDGAYCFFDRNEYEVYITSVYYNRYYIFVNDRLVRSLGDYSSGIFINPADYDSYMNTLYANATSFDLHNLNTILRISGLPLKPLGEFMWLTTGTSVPFSHVKVSPHSPWGTTTLFLGTQAGRLFKVDNAHANPYATEIGSGGFPSGNISCIAVGGSEDTLLVTFSNYGVSSVWQTYDGGTTWGEKEGNLPDIPVRWAVYLPGSSKQAMLATEIGVWTTDNLDENDVYWTPSVQGLANVRVDMLKVRKGDGTVLAATHGRGLFTAKYQECADAGDVNNDCAVDILDILRTISIILGIGDPASEYELSTADMNHDGVIDILDIVAIVNLILAL